MKKIIVLFALLTCSVWMFSQITGSAHDFSAAGWNSTGRICIVCHTPHNADTTVANAPLWNHEVTAVAAYTLYPSGGTMNATPAQPSGISLLCLSCHDGTVALDNFGGASGGTDFVSAANNVGTVLSDDHPIGFTYDAALATADGGLHDPTTEPSGIVGGTTIHADLLGGTGEMHCSSCHDVHDAAGTGIGGFLLVKSNAASALCLTCHDK